MRTSPSVHAGAAADRVGCELRWKAIAWPTDCARPAWRGSAERVDEQLRFNEWFVNYAGSPPIDVVDTTDVPVERTAAGVDAWVRAKLVEPVA